MRKQFKRFLLYAFMMGCVPTFVSSKSITLVDSEGQAANVYIDQCDKFDDVMELIESYYSTDALSSSSGAGQSELALNFFFSNKDIVVRKKSVTRDYYAGVSKQEKKDIGYIVTTLAKESLVSLASSKSSLKKAGDRIEKVHPLNFLMVIFTDEELKAGIHAIRGRTSWIWDEFMGGVNSSMKEESSKDNLKLEFVKDFAQKVGIQLPLILPSIQGARWEELVNILIDTIPRKNDPNRYNM